LRKLVKIMILPGGWMRPGAWTSISTLRAIK
jgi:hypothetical protein